MPYKWRGFLSYLWGVLSWGRLPWKVYMGIRCLMGSWLWDWWSTMTRHFLEQLELWQTLGSLWNASSDFNLFMEKLLHKICSLNHYSELFTASHMLHAVTRLSYLLGSPIRRKHIRPCMVHYYKVITIMIRFSTLLPITNQDISGCWLYVNLILPTLVARQP